MSIDTLFRRAALCAVLALTTNASALTTEAPETDVPPTQADQRFKAKYGIWPPHITAEKRAEKDRARMTEAAKARQNKDKPVKGKSERDRTD